MNNDNVNKKEILSIILKFNLIIGIYNLYLFSIGDSIFNLVIGYEYSILQYSIYFSTIITVFNLFYTIISNINYQYSIVSGIWTK